MYITRPFRLVSYCLFILDLLNYGIIKVALYPCISCQNLTVALTRSAYMDVNLTFDTFAAKGKWENIFCLK